MAKIKIKKEIINELKRRQAIIDDQSSGYYVILGKKKNVIDTYTVMRKSPETIKGCEDFSYISTQRLNKIYNKWQKKNITIFAIAVISCIFKYTYSSLTYNDIKHYAIKSTNVSLNLKLFLPPFKKIITRTQTFSFSSVG